MPLTRGTSKAIFRENLAEMVKSGHSTAQAAAAAYREQRASAAQHAHHAPHQEAAHHGNRELGPRSR